MTVPASRLDGGAAGEAHAPGDEVSHEAFADRLKIRTAGNRPHRAGAILEEQELGDLLGRQGVGQIHDAPPAAEIVARLKAEYEAAKAALLSGETVPTRLKQAAE